MKTYKQNKCRCGRKKYIYSKRCQKCYIKILHKGTKFHPKNCKCSVCKVKRGEYKGKTHPMYGKHHSEKTKKHWSKIRTGRKLSLKTRKKISITSKGKIFSAKTKLKISKANKGKNNPMYRPIGSIHKSNEGYIMIKIKDPNTWVSQHRYFVEKYIGRKLKSTEIVHHIDGCVFQ